MLLPICAECLGHISPENMGKYKCEEHNIQFCVNCQDSQFIVTFRNGKMKVVNKVGERPLMQHAIYVHGWVD